MANYSSRGRYHKNKPGLSRLSALNAPSSKCLSQTGIECGELLEALKSIQSVIQCYSCHQPLSSVRTCLNGHGICSDCRARYNKNCPVPKCNCVILDLKPVMLNEVIKLLPRSCKFSPQGCSTVVFAKDNDHETFCRFRPTDCRFPQCTWTGSAKELLLHLERFHGQDMIRTASETQILTSFNANVNREGLAVIVAFNNIFWRHVRVFKNQLMQFYQYVPMEKPQKKFSVLVEYHTSEVSYSRETPVHTDICDREQLFTHKETFCLPRKIAKSFKHFYGGGVHFTFRIFQDDQ